MNYSLRELREILFYVYTPVTLFTQVIEIQTIPPKVASSLLCKFSFLLTSVSVAHSLPVVG